MTPGAEKVAKQEGPRTTYFTYEDTGRTYDHRKPTFITAVSGFACRDKVSTMSSAGGGATDTADACFSGAAAIEQHDRSGGGGSFSGAASDGNGDRFCVQPQGASVDKSSSLCQHRKTPGDIGDNGEQQSCSCPSAAALSASSLNRLSGTETVPKRWRLANKISHTTVDDPESALPRTPQRGVLPRTLPSFRRPNTGSCRGGNRNARTNQPLEVVFGAGGKFHAFSRLRVALSATYAFAQQRARKQQALTASNKKPHTAPRWTRLRGAQEATRVLLRAARLGSLDSDESSEISNPKKGKGRSRVAKGGDGESQNSSLIWSEGSDDPLLSDSSWSGESLDTEVGGWVRVATWKPNQ